MKTPSLKAKTKQTGGRVVKECKIRMCKPGIETNSRYKKVFKAVMFRDFVNIAFSMVRTNVKMKKYVLFLVGKITHNLYKHFQLCYFSHDFQTIYLYFAESSIDQS